MNAKKELEQRIFATFSEGVTVTAEAVSEILKDYIILKENDDQRSDLHRRIKYYLGAKKIDGLSERTLKNYKYNLELFAGRVTKSAAKVTTDDIRGYIAYLDETRHLAETSLQTHINTLRAFFGWLHVEEKIKKNPMSKIKSLKLDKKGARQALSVEELERLRDACEGYREKALATDDSTAKTLDSMAAKIVELQSASNDVMDALTELAGIVAGGGEDNG